MFSEQQAGGQQAAIQQVLCNRYFATAVPGSGKKFCSFPVGHSELFCPSFLLLALLYFVNSACFPLISASAASTHVFPSLLAEVLEDLHCLSQSPLSLQLFKLNVCTLILKASNSEILHVFCILLFERTLCELLHNIFF